jgi:hypothetical protein
VKPTVLAERAIRTAHRLTQAFMDGAIDLSGHPTDATAGWEGLPEVWHAQGLREGGASESEVRLFLTFACAMERPSDTAWVGLRLLSLAEPWLLHPEYALAHEHEIAVGLDAAMLDQRHGLGLSAWMTVARTLAALGPWSQISWAIRAGHGEVTRILGELQALRRDEASPGPQLGGPDDGRAWLRMLSYPGGVRLHGLAMPPVIVDHHVRRASEALGITAIATKGMSLRDAGSSIQAAWDEDVATGGAVAPGDLANTCLALDMVLRFFGKHCCGYCESVRARVPAASVCEQCQAVF